MAYFDKYSFRYKCIIMYSDFCADLIKMFLY
jgi:hypothetical protein